MNRQQGAGPFTAKAGSGTITGDVSQNVRLAVVSDVLGEPFCYVNPADCHGGDMAAAKARATRIAEALNRAG